MLLLKEITLHAGDCYIASPNVMLHAVQYDQVDKSDLIIAIQCRMDFTKQELARLQSKEQLMQKDSKKIASAAQDKVFTIPTLADIVQMEQKICNTHVTTQTFLCPQCHKSFGTKGGLSNHSNIHKERFVCHVCNRKCESKSKLKRHLQIHANNRQYQCVQCGKSFNFKYNLTSHLKTHDAVKSWTCTRCHRKFLRHSDLKRHCKTCKSL